MTKNTPIMIAVASFLLAGCGKEDEETGSGSGKQTTPRKEMTRAPAPEPNEQPSKTAGRTEPAGNQPAPAEATPRPDQQAAPEVAEQKPAPEELEPLPEDVQALSKMAEEGNARAQFALGNRYSNGNGVPQDLAEAAKWYRAAAEQGQPDAAYSLGMMYETGHGVNQDPEEAQKWYRMYNQNSPSGN